MEPIDDDLNRKPFEVSDVYWLYADRKTGHYPRTTPQSGKWLIWVPEKEIDEVWDRIRRATEEGRLGSQSKVATARPSPLAVDPRKRVICVYTYDWTDEKDVRQIREELRKLGITEPIPYKSDADTLAGKYKAKGHKRISKYYE